MGDPSILNFQNLNDAQYQMLMATGMSQALVYALNRSYYDYPITSVTKPEFLTLNKTYDLTLPSLLSFEKIGVSSSEDINETLISMQTVLQTCHNPLCTQLVFLITSDGKYNSIYLGVRSTQYSFNSDEFTEQYLGDFIESSLPGTKVKLLSSDNSSAADSCCLLQKQLKEYKSAVAITGIPSTKAFHQTNFSVSLNKMLTGMRGKKYAYIVVADPVAENMIDPLIFACREMTSQAKMLTSITMSNTMQSSISKTIGQSLTQSTNWSKSDSVSKKNLSPLVLAGLMASAVIFPPSAFASAIAGSAGSAMLASSGINALMGLISTKTEGRQEGGGTSNTKNESETIGSSESKAITMNYVNSHVDAMIKYLSFFENRFLKSKAVGSWNVGVYMLTEHENEGVFAASQLKALLSGSDSYYEPIRLHPLKWYWNGNGKDLLGAKDVLSFMAIPNISLSVKTNELEGHPFGTLFQSLTTHMTTDELVLLVNLPKENASGISISKIAPFPIPREITGDVIKIGKCVDRGQQSSIDFSLPTNGFSKHVLVSGINGSGKTFTSQRILEQLLLKDIPFLVIEPSKDQYVDWAMSINQKSREKGGKDLIKIFAPGTKTWKNGEEIKNILRINPFDVVWLSEKLSPPVIEHIDCLKNILIAALPMQEVLPVVLEELIYYVYALKSLEDGKTSWIEGRDTVVPEFDACRPNFDLLLMNIDNLLKTRSYEDKIKGNIKAALRTRIEGLTLGFKKDLFLSGDLKANDWVELFNTPAVINLDSINSDEDKAFIMSVLLMFLCEFRKEEVKLKNTVLSQSDELKHLLLIEEAHRIMEKPQVSYAGAADAQGKVSKMFSHMLSEFRAYGQGVMIVDQVPGRLIPDAIKNTNVKITHKLVSQNDRNAIAASMSLTEAQADMIGRLEKGNAIISGDTDDLLSWVKVSGK